MVKMFEEKFRKERSEMVHNMHGALLNDRVPLKGYLSSASQVVIVQQLLFCVSEKFQNNQHIVSGELKQNLANRNNNWYPQR